MTPSVTGRRWSTWIPWSLLLVLSVTVHLWDLGERSYHHDEAIHAKLSWDLATAGRYQYDPTYHGPVLYYLTAATYLTLGDTDFTARLPAAVAGIGMIGVAWCLRRRLGERAAWWTGLLFTISPLTLFYGRFLRMDLLELVTASGALVAWTRVVRDRPRAWAWLGFWTGLAFATKENSYVTAALLGATAVLLGVDRGLRTTVPMAVSWLSQRWAGVSLSLAVFVLVTVPLYTVGFTRPEDWLFPVRAIDYWWEQHSIQRVAGPWWFHLPRLLQYEFLVLAAAAVWVVRRWRRLRTLELSLAIFGVLSILMYIYLGEKVPWLGVHQIWAFVPLAGLQLARTFGPQGRWWSRSLAGLGLAATLVVSFVANFVLEEISPRQQRVVESLHFVQTCPELTAVAREVVARSAEDPSYRVAVDGEAAWPLNWYWRDLPVRWGRPAAGERPSLVICDPEEVRVVSDALGPGYASERIPLRAWWLMYAGDPTPVDFLRYLVTRRPWGEIGSSDVMVFRPDGAAGTSVRPVVIPDSAARALAVQNDAIAVGKGWLGEVRGVALDGERLAAADPSLSRIVAFSLDGLVDERFAIAGLEQPEGVAWHLGGALLIADTWNHRVLALQPDGSQIVLPAPPEGWYGPRAIACSTDGRVAVTDTGHHRVVVFRTDLHEPRTFPDGPGGAQLLEPGGLAWTSDRSVLVADTGHRRLVELDVDDGRELRAVDLPDAWPDYYSRPQVAVLQNGTWIATDAPAGALWVVSGDEPAVRVVIPGLTPAGVAVDRISGRLALGDLAGEAWLMEVDK